MKDGTQIMKDEFVAKAPARVFAGVGETGGSSGLNIATVTPVAD